MQKLANLNSEDGPEQKLANLNSEDGPEQRLAGPVEEDVQKWLFQPRTCKCDRQIRAARTGAGSRSSWHRRRAGTLPQHLSAASLRRSATTLPS